MMLIELTLLRITKRGILDTRVPLSPSAPKLSTPKTETSPKKEITKITPEVSLPQVEETIKTDDTISQAHTA